MMRRARRFPFLFALVLGFFGWGAAAPLKAQITETSRPAHPATEAQIREYLSLLHVEKLAQSTLDSSLRAAQATSAPYYPPGFWDDFRHEIKNLDFVSVYVEVYQRYLSQEEMQAILDFYHSSAGKKLLEAQPLMVADAQDALRTKGAEIGAAVYAKHKDEIEAAKKKYEEGTHPSPK